MSGANSDNQATFQLVLTKDQGFVSLNHYRKVTEL